MLWLKQNFIFFFFFFIIRSAKFFFFFFFSLFFFLFDGIKCFFLYISFNSLVVLRRVQAEQLNTNILCDSGQVI